MRSFSVIFSVGVLLALSVHSAPDTEFIAAPVKFDNIIKNADRNSLDNGNEIDDNGGPAICGTERCAKEASSMLSSLDDAIDPCDNFYDFACGNFVRNTILPKNKTIIMSFTEVQDKVEEQLRTILTEEPYPNESKAFRLAKTFNRACLNETALNEMGKNESILIYRLRF